MNEFKVSAANKWKSDWIEIIIIKNYDSWKLFKSNELKFSAVIKWNQIEFIIIKNYDTWKWFKLNELKVSAAIKCKSDWIELNLLLLKIMILENYSNKWIKSFCCN